MGRSRFTILLSVGFCLCHYLPAQSNFATLTGNESDSSGAAVPRANLEAVNVATNYRYTGQSDEAGIYTIVNVLEGVYRLKVTAAGFQDFIADNVQLQSRDLRRVDVALSAGTRSRLGIQT